MIKKSEVMQLLINACPSYRDKWKEHFDYCYSNGEEQLLYVDLGNFAQHLIDLYKKGDLDEFDNIFEIIELLHIEGDDYVKEAAIVGLLEDIQNFVLSNNINEEEFFKFLKPISAEWWNKLNDFWQGKGSLE